MLAMEARWLCMGARSKRSAFSFVACLDKGEMLVRFGAFAAKQNLASGEPI